MSDNFSEHPELTAYKRWPDIEAENQRVSGLNRHDWIGEAKHVPSETLVFMILQIEREDEQLFGVLLQELSGRTVRIATRWAQGLDPVVAEQVAFQVDLQIIELLLSDKTSKQLDFLGVAFSLAIVRRTTDAVRKHKRSAMGRRGEILFEMQDADGDDFNDSESSIEFALDDRPGPETILLEIEDNVLRRDFYKKACDAVEDPRHLEAVILFHGHGWPVESKDPNKPDLAHYFNVTPRQVRYWIKKALDSMRDTIGVQK